MKSGGLPGTALHLFDDLQHPHDAVPEQHATPLPPSVPFSLDIAVLLLNLLPSAFLLHQRHQRHLPMDHVILALSGTHLVSGTLGAPLTLLVSRHVYACYVYQFVALASQLLVLHLVSVLCVERWVALRHLIHNHSHGLFQPEQSTSTLKWVMLTLALLCIFIASLPFYGLAPSIHSPRCEAWVIAAPQRPQEHVFCFFFLVIGFANVLLVVMVNTSQVVGLCQYVRVASSKQHVIVSAAERKQVVEFALMVLLVTTLFHLTWIPALALLTLHHAYVTVPRMALTYASLATTLPALLSPLLYAAVSRTYRAGYVTFLTRGVQGVRGGTCLGRGRGMARGRGGAGSQTGAEVLPTLSTRRSNLSHLNHHSSTSNLLPPRDTGTGTSNGACALDCSGDQRMRVEQNYQLSFISETMEDENCEEITDETVQLCRYERPDRQHVVTYHPAKEDTSYEE